MMLREGIVEDGYAAKDRVAWQLMGLCLTLCGSFAVGEDAAMCGHANENKMVPRPRG